MGKQRYLIVGGVAGGASAAARLRRLDEDAEIVLFERGEHISFANCGLPYHIGGDIPKRESLLVASPAKMAGWFRIEVRTQHEVLRVDVDKQEVTVRDLVAAQEYTESYDKLVLSPGAEPVRPPIPGVQADRVFSLRNLADMDAIKAVVDDGSLQRAVVIGGGYIGLEMVEALVQRDVPVVLVELLPQVMGPADPEMVTPLHATLKERGVDLRLGTSVTEVAEQGNALVLTLSDGQTLAADLAILAVGVRPEVLLAQTAGLSIGKRGGIQVDEHMRTSAANIYAVGDAVEVTDLVGGFATLIPLAGPANRQGRIAADNICGRKTVYKQTQGTAICKLFDLAIGMTGASEKALQRAGRVYEKIYVHPASHAGYYPGAAPMTLKLLFDPQDGKVLGAQAVGTDGIDKRIDVLAVAIRAGLTVYDLQDMELSYAPPFGSAKDAVNYAGFVAVNALNGDMPLCHVADMQAPQADQMLLDVRTPGEFKRGSIAGAVNIPLPELRERLTELEASKEILVFCQVGLRGHVAARILLQRGFQARNLTGGYQTYLAVTAAG